MTLSLSGFHYRPISDSYSYSFKGCNGHYNHITLTIQPNLFTYYTDIARILLYVHSRQFLKTPKADNEPM